MKFIKTDEVRDADSAEDAKVPTALYEARVAELEDRITQLPAGFDPLEKAEIQNGIGALLLELERSEEAFDIAREAFDAYTSAESWEGAVQACNLMFAADQPQSLAALGQGIWLAVTFPEVDPELSCAMLQHVVEETPDDSDGAAVAATVARYVVDLRTEGKKHDELTFFCNQLLGQVARRHSEVQDQAAFDLWIERLELDDPDKFLVRMRNIVDVLVQDDWWIDREAIWAKLPTH
ncbi:MAG: hypothetical protein EP301_10635 [Gammaproteobacteria bacterium]|nr:MAG: hypothetical protein EP301_10635 [Gammaproteobacteria bacterium]